jgi:hypothetical protein
MIERIDAARLGVVPEQVEEVSQYGHRLRKFCGWAMTEMSLAADRMPGLTDRDLSRRAASLVLLLAHERLKIAMLVRLHGLSRRRMRALSPEDPVRRQLEEHDERIRFLEGQHEEVVRCLNSRKFLKTRMDWIAGYLEIFGKSQPKVAPYTVREDKTNGKVRE